MAEKQLTHFAVLMDLLSISTVELSKVINIERTAISRWRHGVNKIKTDMPYFEEIVNFIVQKNNSLGNELLEDFFESVYPVKKRLHKNNMKRCVRSYILSIPDARMSFANTEVVTLTKHTAADARLNAFINMLETAERLSVPTDIKIFEVEQFTWVGCDTLRLNLFYQKLKLVLDLGHKVSIIFQAKEPSESYLGLHQVFTELIFHENLSLYYYSVNSGREHTHSIYILSRRLVVIGYLIGDGLDRTLSYTLNDMEFLEAQEMIWDRYKLCSSDIMTIEKYRAPEKVIANIKASIYREGDYYISGKTLSFVTMSEALLDEVLLDNNLTKEQMRLCMEFYNSIRSNIESSPLCDMSGFYFILSEITAPLTNPLVTCYVLSAITGRTIRMSRNQYLRHFKDTADILLRDDRYRVFLHYALISEFGSMAYPKSILHKHECWTAAVNEEAFPSRIRLIYGDNYKTSGMFDIEFHDIYEKIPPNKRTNAYAAGIFMEIAEGRYFSP